MVSFNFVNRPRTKSFSTQGHLGTVIRLMNMRCSYFFFWQNTCRSSVLICDLPYIKQVKRIVVLLAQT